MDINEPIEPRRFLFVLFEGGGNVPPTLGLAKGLVERGHSVRVMSDPCNQTEVRLAGCEFTPYHRTPHRLDKTAASTLITDYEQNNPIQR
jgi:UDP:flavonoid glycosyltransferase YjiC (YdhE family)